MRLQSILTLLFTSLLFLTDVSALIEDSENNCDGLTSVSGLDLQTSKLRKTFITADNKIAVEFSGYVVIKSNATIEDKGDKIFALEPESVEFEPTVYWEVLKFKSKCIDFDVLFIKSKIYQTLGFRRIELNSKLPGKSNWKYGSANNNSVFSYCHATTGLEDSRNRFKNAFACDTKRSIICNDLSGKIIADISVTHLKVEFYRNSTAPAGEFESKQFVNCLSRQEYDEQERVKYQWKSSTSASSDSLSD